MTARSWHACRCRYCKRLLWRGTTTVDSCAALSCRNLLTRLPRPSHGRCQSALLVNHGPRPAGTALLGSDARTAQWHGDLAARACQPAPEPAALLRVQALLAQASPPPAPLHERCDAAARGFLRRQAAPAVGRSGVCAWVRSGRLRAPKPLLDILVRERHRKRGGGDGGARRMRVPWVGSGDLKRQQAWQARHAEAVAETHASL